MLMRADLEQRHALLTEERERMNREARERDLGYAYALGEIEHWLALLSKREEEQEQSAALAQLLEGAAA